LAAEGERVRLVSRRGSGPEQPGIDLVAADAADAALIEELTRDAATLFNCAMPAYDRWPAEWPPLAASLLQAAERAGADYVMLGNAYAYGPVEGPVTEATPLAATSVKGRIRARMWHDALTAHQAGRMRVTEVRGSDMLGAAAVSLYILTVLPEVLAGRPVAYLGDPDVPHSWTYAVDAARALVAASRSERSWGRAWHIPSTSELSTRRLTERLAEVADLPAPRIERMPRAELARAAAADSVMAEVPEMLYLFERPMILDSTHTEVELGLKSTPPDEVLLETARAALEAPL
jgi:nucleoside-diphosphate-sugar epimerase